MCVTHGRARYQNINGGRPAKIDFFQCVDIFRAYLYESRAKTAACVLFAKDQLRVSFFFIYFFHFVIVNGTLLIFLGLSRYHGGNGNMCFFPLKLFVLGVYGSY